ncbi:MAG: 50S ribosomal protein L18e [Thermoplasmata archaeon]|nr:50S ribosomal protein L18e [Thermoplasmata archaeon]
MKKNKKSNQHLVDLIQDLKRRSHENSAPIWRDVAKRLERPSKNWAEVNISRIARHVEKDTVVLVPGKLLGSGDIDIPVTIASYRASESAVNKINSAGGRVMTIQDLMKENPKGTGVRLMG